MNPMTLFITGSRHPVNYWGADLIAIGCNQRTISEWQEVYARVGANEKYTEDQIAEYGRYIDMIAELHKTKNHKQ